ncbi:MAG: hypothetical protein A3D39_02750 [Candidatus Buchananbacteria bacterium RIFCSPHIGHO2_02_FULL_39_17]|nr:MAG: hypothetical protein A3D39_02750 [Candidatus Buchananbacteria bacterium RIFCSPHIGHO2_02_FULL_39_17]
MAMERADISFAAEEKKRQGEEEADLTPKVEQSLKILKERLAMVKKYDSTALVDSSVRITRDCLDGARYLVTSGEYDRLTPAEQEYVDGIIETAGLHDLGDEKLRE